MNLRFLNKSGVDAIGANTDLSDLAIQDRTNAFEIRIKPAFIDIMGMADIIADQ